MQPSTVLVGEQIPGCRTLLFEHGAPKIVDVPKRCGQIERACLDVAQMRIVKELSQSVGTTGRHHQSAIGIRRRRLRSELWIPESSALVLHPHSRHRASAHRRAPPTNAETPALHPGSTPPGRGPRLRSGRKPDRKSNSESEQVPLQLDYAHSGAEGACRAEGGRSFRGRSRRN